MQPTYRLKPGTIDQLGKNALVLLGYPDDRGIANLGGRPGAQSGPNQIRKSLYRLIPPIPTKDFLDLGDIPMSQDLGVDHQAALIQLRSIPGDCRIVTLGGGHDWAYPDVMVFLERYKTKKPLVINIDAHLDVRPTEGNTINSGTPFFRVFENFGPFELFQIGIQEANTNPAHLEYCLKRKVRIFWRHEITKAVTAIKKIAKGRPVFLSVDIDGFHSGIAPGASAAQPTGIDWNEYLQLSQAIRNRGDIKALGIYEVSPPLDRDDQTSRLAAHIVHLFWRGLN